MTSKKSHMLNDPRLFLAWDSDLRMTSFFNNLLWLIAAGRPAAL